MLRRSRLPVLPIRQGPFAALTVLSMLALAGCSLPATPAAAPAPTAITVALAQPTEKVVEIVVTPTAQPPTAVVRSPVAKLVRVEPDGECRWVAYMYLTGFAPNSVITVEANFNEAECGTGKKQAPGHWSKLYGTKTDATGRLMVDYFYKATGSYVYVFTDDQGNHASLPLTIEPAAGQPATAAPEPSAVVQSATLNLRSGPGQNYTVVGRAAKGDTLYPTARVGKCAWLQVGVVGQSDLVWVSGGQQFVALNVPCETLMVQESIPPTPLPKPTSPPRPTAPPQQQAQPRPVAPARPETGLLSRSGNSGSGRLIVKNGTDSDGVVILVTTGGDPVQAAYIGAGDSYEMGQIADGSYRLYFTKGQGWDAAAKQFTANVTRQRFADTLAFGGDTAGYEVTLYGVSGGNAATEGVPAGQFPGVP